MTVPEHEGLRLPGRPETDLTAATRPGPAPVTELLALLEGLDRRPLPDQVERLDAVRKGLDDALARPGDGPTGPVPAPAAGRG